MYGLLAIRYLKALANGDGDFKSAINFANSQKSWDYQSKDSIVQHLKGAVSGLDLASVAGGSNIALDFLSALYPMSIVGRLQGLRRVPKNVSVLTQLTGSVAGWTGDGRARRLSAGTFARKHLIPLSVSAMTVSSNELLADASFDAETELLRDLLNAGAAAWDNAFVDPANAGVTGVIPAAVTNGVTPISMTGDTLAAFDLALATAIKQITSAGSNLINATWICSPVLAAGLALARGTGGDQAYEGVQANGGTLLGLPLLTSGSVGLDTDGEQLYLIDGSQITICEGPPTLSVSKNASIAMSTTPTGNTTVPTASTGLTSMFQAESTALLASLAINWTLRHAGCCQVITGLPSQLDAS